MPCDGDGAPGADAAAGYKLSQLDSSEMVKFRRCTGLIAQRAGRKAYHMHPGVENVAPLLVGNAQPLGGHRKRDVGHRAGGQPDSLEIDEPLRRNRVREPGPDRRARFDPRTSRPPEAPAKRVARIFPLL